MELPGHSCGLASSHPLRRGSILLLVTAAIAATLGGTLAADTARWTTTERRCDSKVNVLLTVQADQEGWDVADLLADADVPLTDQTTCMVDRLCQTELEDLRLQPT